MVGRIEPLKLIEVSIRSPGLETSKRSCEYDVKRSVLQLKLLALAITDREGNMSIQNAYGNPTCLYSSVHQPIGFLSQVNENDNKLLAIGGFFFFFLGGIPFWYFFSNRQIF